jgi:predicted dehydrogenase/threonine dehydrogenase-like Zn-dependent dehydrogenase
MKQIVQNLRNGATILEEIPAPMLKDGHLLIQTSFSLVSSGTERMLVSFGKANWLQKAMQQPERVKLVRNKLKTDGLRPTLHAVLSKINKPLALGYSNSGIVIGVGKGVVGYKVGDRVASNGHHAEVVLVPQNLVAKIPEHVSDEDAAFTVVAAIALQGIRLASPAFGETIVVFGLGLIGQITAQLLQANGCKVLGIDTDLAKCQLAEKQGIKCFCSQNEFDIVSIINAQTNNTGADAVIITASADGDNIIAEAAAMSRKRGRIILVGVVGLNINRADFYEKELSFQVSCSYGPGRYDLNYEQNGQDYPIGFVRWTEQRNFDAVLHAIASSRLNVKSLISQCYPIEEYEKVYSSLSDSAILATLLKYDTQKKEHSNVVVISSRRTNYSKGTIGVIGAGNFASNTILPSLQKCHATIKTIVSEHGLNATHLAKKYSIGHVSTNVQELLYDNEIDAVVIATTHHTHAALCIAALNVGKHVFVEKPLALNLTELDQIAIAYENGNCILNVGFNRRCAPLAIKMKTLLSDTDAPMNIVITVNAGKLDKQHWLNDRDKSGGRIIGEVCHFVDLCSFLSNAKVMQVCANAMSDGAEDVSILLRYDNGTNAVINYFSNGHKAYDKERIEVYQHEKVLVLENWKKLSGFGFKGFSSVSLAQDKGHNLQFKLFNEAVQQNAAAAIIPFDSIVNTSKATIAATQSLQQNNWISIS